MWRVAVYHGLLVLLILSVAALGVLAGLPWPQEAPRETAGLTDAGGGAQASQTAGMEERGEECAAPVISPRTGDGFALYEAYAWLCRVCAQASAG